MRANGGPAHIGVACPSAYLDSFSLVWGLAKAVIAETFVGYCLLLSPYLCFNSFLYRDLYVL